MACVDTTAMKTNRYRITYLDFSQKDRFGRDGLTIIVAEAAEGSNGIEAIKNTLRARGIDEADISQARSVGSNKRLTLAGITFTADKLSS